MTEIHEIPKSRMIQLLAQKLYIIDSIISPAELEAKGIENYCNEIIDHLTTLKNANTYGARSNNLPFQLKEVLTEYANKRIIRPKIEFVQEGEEYVLDLSYIKPEEPLETVEE